MVADQPGRGTVQVISAVGADFAVSAGYILDKATRRLCPAFLPGLKAGSPAFKEF
jgi:hypothetical protein